MGLELADIFRQYPVTCSNSEQARAVAAIRDCRTAELGGHLQKCSHCGHKVPIFNSCRSRHCPKCQCLKRAEWVERRRAELLPVAYYHIVFTMPHELAALALQNQKLIYDILFWTSAQALQDVAANPKYLGARVGLVSVIHTWGQSLIHHPHIHCLVPGGGLSIDGQNWVECKHSFFLPVRVLSTRYRTLFLDALQSTTLEKLTLEGALASLSIPANFTNLLTKLRRKKWVVFIQAPFSEPEAILRYQARYANRTALTNDRLLELEHDRVKLSYKDYSQKSIRKTMILDVAEFARRFLQHVLPRGFARIRYYGALANRNKHAFLAAGYRHKKVEPVTLGPPKSWQQQFFALTGREPDLCRKCNAGRLTVIEELEPLRAIRWRVAQLSPLPSITRGPP
jgi:Putative transposase/Transposase zinc-binding domain